MDHSGADQKIRLPLHFVAVYALNFARSLNSFMSCMLVVLGILVSVPLNVIMSPT